MRSLKVVCAKFAGVRAHPNPGHGIPIAEPNPHHLNTATYCTHTSSEEEHPNQPYKLFPGKTLSLERCFSLDDVHAFCRLCHITDPIRLQISETQSRGYSACVVPELLYSGLFPAIIGTHFSGVCDFVLEEGRQCSCRGRKCCCGASKPGPTRGEQVPRNWVG
eukprot:c16066_g1_i2 orf=86-574(-)